MTENAPETLATGTGMAEGPVWCDDGTLVFVSVDRGLLYRLDPATGALAVVADTAGGPNAATPAADGGFVVTQNGGVDWAALGMPDMAPVRPVTPGLQHVGADGTVRYLAEGGFSSPNDLVVDAAGIVLFTDHPKGVPAGDERSALVWAHDPAGGTRAFARGFALCNGIALDVGGAPLVTEWGGSVVRLGPDGGHETAAAGVGAVLDGLCVDVDGRMFVASPMEGRIVVVEDGRAVDALVHPDAGHVTNCCFGGPDRRTLFATVGAPGEIVAWEAMPSPGLPVHRWPGGG